MPNESLATDFNEVQDATPEAAETTQNARDENGVPYCIKHHCKMKLASGGKKGSAVAYYSCPVSGCKETAKKLKNITESSIPSEPHKCPRCSSDKKPSVLERSKRLSNASYTILECEACGYKSSPMPRPEFVAIQNRARKMQTAPAKSLGDR